MFKSTACVVATAILATAPKVLACDMISYFRYSDGRCVNLSALTWMNVAAERQRDVEREAVPYKFTITDLVDAAVPGGTLVGKVTLTNVSKFTTIKTAWATLVAPNGSRWSPFVERDLKPGESHVEQIFFTASPGQVDIPGTFKAEYTPKVDRDWGGVSSLFEQREQANNRAYPYPRRELTICLAAYCPRSMMRSASPAQASSAPASQSAPASGGKCDRSGQLDARGNRCGARSADSKRGGR